MSAKILILDIETAPAKVFAWGTYDQNIGLSQIIEDSYMLSWSAKWLGESKIHSDCLYYHQHTFKHNRRDESQIAKSIWKLLDQADIIVAHNGDNFDIKWLNTVFLRTGMKPPSTFKSVDTLKVSRGNFYMISHRLNYLCQVLDIGHKLKHEGFELWPKCMNGDKHAWNRMMHYNKKDVILLEELYTLVRPFIPNHPNLSMYSDGDKIICSGCGGSDFKKKGFAYTNVNKYQRYVCKNCGKNIRDRHAIKKDKKRGERAK